MVATTIADYEKRALTSNNIKPSEFGPIPILRFEDPKNSAYYLKQTFVKQQIVLHHTVGNPYGDLLTLTQPQLVSVPFIITPNGTIIQLFSPKYWSYHLGKTALGGNAIQSRKSIGIELSNYGWLIKSGSYMIDAYGKKYCNVSDRELYTETEPYRGYRYWAPYSPAQMLSLKLLTKELSNQFNIPLNLLPESLRMARTPTVVGHKGITTHVNFRLDKWDVSPVFDWSIFNP